MTELEGIDNEFFESSKRIIANAKTLKMTDNGAHSYSEGSEQQFDPVKASQHYTLYDKISITPEGREFLHAINEGITKKRELEDQLKQREETIQQLKEALKGFKDVLTTLNTKQIEYNECAVEGNMNWEYFKGKADAYEFAAKQLKRIFEWHGIE